MRSPLRASLIAEKGPSVPVIFCFCGCVFMARGKVVEEGVMRSPFRAFLGSERGPSVPVIFCFIWLRSHGGW